MSKFVYNRNDYEALFSELTVEDTEFCCGVKEIGEFPTGTLSSYIQDMKYDWRQAVGNWRYDNVKSAYPKLPSDTYFKKLLTQGIKDLFYNVGLNKTGTIYFCTLIDCQQWIKPILISQGFRLVSDRTINSNSGNRIYVYLRDPRTVKGSKLKSKRF